MASESNSKPAINPDEFTEINLDANESAQPKDSDETATPVESPPSTQPETQPQPQPETQTQTQTQTQPIPQETGTNSDAPRKPELNVDTDAEATSPTTEIPHEAVFTPKTPGESPRTTTNTTPRSPHESIGSRQSRSASIRRSRNASIALAHTSVNGTQSRPAIMFIQNAFEKIKVSKDAKRIPALHTASTRVLERFTQIPDRLPPPKMVLEPLRLVCVPPGSSNELKEVAIDTLGQLFALSYFGIIEDEQEQTATLAEAVNVVSDAWEAEGADQKVEVQIIKALTAAVVNEDLIVHGSVLMRAVRQVYHIYVVTRSQANQGLAQVSLTQMVQAVFERVKARSNMTAKLDATNSSVSVASQDNAGAEGEETNATLTLKEIQSTPLPDVEESDAVPSELERITQDAGLLFRTLCRLSMKIIDENDVKSQPMRSKLLSLHLLHMILKHHISLFKNKRVIVRKSRTESEPLAFAIKPYLRQAMAQNALSPMPAAFEITAEIFWLILANLRSEFKPELAVFFTEVYFTAMDMKTATMHQRLYFMTLLSRICTDPRLLVELYLNYDCDPAAPNVFEKLMEMVSRVALKPANEPPANGNNAPTRMSIDRQQIRVYDLNAPPAVAISHLIAAPASSSGGSMLTSQATIQQQQLEVNKYQLKTAALEAMLNVLRSLVIWSQRGADETHESTEDEKKSEGEHAAAATNTSTPNGKSDSRKSGSHTKNQPSTTSIDENSPRDSQTSLASDKDDPDQFASRKKNKRVLDAAVQEFNFSPARGLKKFVEAGLLKDIDNAVEVATLLLKTDGLDKAQLGEFLGKNSEFNQQVMYQFVYAMDFKKKSFVAALRGCLQQFRLPGEGQVVDRYMQTFAKKYFEDNSDSDGVHPDFASADAAWVLAMSVMMLNTDLHAAALGLRRQRMTDEQFIKNNKGMNDGVDFRAELLMDIYQEIKSNEIKLDSEQAEVAIKDEAYDVASDAITSRATQFFQSAPPLEIVDYYNASHTEHIRPMFELSWLAVLAGISNPFSQLKDPLALNACLEGFELALRIACHFDVAIARVSFMQTLSQATLLMSPERIGWKNIGAIHALFRVALSEADALRDSWYDMLRLVSQLEKVQLIAQGSMNGHPQALHSVNGSSAYAAGTAGHSGHHDIPRDVAEALLSRELVVDIDRIFTNTQNMTNEGAVHFVKALSRVSLEEIGSAESEPRLFALQKMVDVCYYNSVRIRMGWSELWDAAMAEQFAKVLVENNTQVVMFALDSLRQLSMRFLEIDEMPHFAFQQEFLQPFRHALLHNSNTGIRVLVLECLKQMVMTRSDKLKSGWDTIFSTVRAASEAEPPVVEAAYQLLTVINVEAKVPPGYLEACSAIAEQPEAKTALRAVELMHKLVETHPYDMPLWQLLSVHLSAAAMQGKDLEVRGRCLEILFKLLNDNGHRFSRSDWDEMFTRSLGPLFSVLHGQTGRRSRSLARSPQRSPQRSPTRRSPQRSPARSPHHSPTRNAHAHFAVPPQQHQQHQEQQHQHYQSRPSKSHLEVPHYPSNQIGDTSTAASSRHETPFASSSDLTANLASSRSPTRQRQREEMSLWLSSTLIQALKSLIALFHRYFDMLEHALDPFFLELLRTCILQENDPVSRMGNSCLQLIISENADRFTEKHWTLIVSKLVELFKDTTATLLLDRSVLDAPPADAADMFRSMTARTMQALLVIGTVRELFVGSKPVFEAIPVAQLLRVTTRLRMSYNFAREFNRLSELRHELYQRGFFRQTPNLLHQESQAAQTYVSVSMRIFKSPARFESDPSARQDVADELMPFCAQALADYNKLKESEPRHISKLAPIVESILRHIVEFGDEDFKQLVPVVYGPVVGVLSKPMSPRLRDEVQQILLRVGNLYVIPKKE